MCAFYYFYFLYFFIFLLLILLCVIILFNFRIIFMYMCNQFNVMSTMEIRRAHLCDFFLVLLFYDIFMYKIMCCK